MKNLLSAFLMVVAAGCAAQTQEPSVLMDQGGHRFAHEEAAIRDLRATNNRAMAARNLDGTMTIVADDHVIVAGNGEIIRSAAAIRAAWAQDFRDPGFSACERHPERVEVGEARKVLRGAENGRWRCPAKTANGESVWRGSYFAHWSKASGEWRVVSDNYVTLGCSGAGCKVGTR